MAHPKPRAGRRRPYKVAYHYDGTRRTDSETGITWVDTNHPIDGKSSSHEQDAVERIARDVSRRGGRAEVTHVDPDTGIVTTILTLAEYEVAQGDGMASAPHAAASDMERWPQDRAAGA